MLPALKKKKHFPNFKKKKNVVPHKCSDLLSVQKHDVKPCLDQMFNLILLDGFK